MGSTELTSQNVGFSDQNPSYTYAVESYPDATYSAADMDDAELGDFFSRPVKIADFQWSTSVNFYQQFDPWSLYFDNPRVCNRISNFNLLRAKLHVKILVNGNGFYYGRLLANYKPIPECDEFILDRALIPQDNISASQRPHIYLDPTTSQGGEMILPFFWWNNALSIPKSEWSRMGDMSIRTLNQLKHANGSTDPITVSVFAWASDVSLSIPTSFNPRSLTPQMGMEKAGNKKKSKPKVTFKSNKPKPKPSMQDEYGSGMVSKPASTVARIAGMLAQAPIIGPYARATEIAAGGVANIAKLFGYSRPNDLDPIKQFTPRFMGDLATTNLPDSIQKLTLDAKQELCVDGSTLGLSNTDEMTITSVACRESYYTQFRWAMLTDPETHLFSTAVSPVVWDTLAGGVLPEVHMPACCFATLPFREWRGSMNFRFQVVASNYHRGRIKIVYEPHDVESNEYITNYTQIVDISEEKDFTVTVGWGNRYAYLPHRSPGVSDLPYDTAAPIVSGGIFENGILSVYVVNELTSPNSVPNNDVQINVFVSAGDDFEVKNPDATLIENLTPFLPQSGFEAQSGEEGVVQGDEECTNEPSAPMQDLAATTMAAHLDVSDPMSSVYFGEDITSFRQCLKRYNFFSYFPFNTSDTPSLRIITYILDFFPFYRGQAGANSAFGASGNYCKLTMLNYLTPAYQAWRGGIKWKWQLVGGIANSSYSNMTISRVPQTTTVANVRTATQVSLTGAAAEVLMQTVNNLLPNIWSGAMATSAQQQPVVEAEIPFQQHYRFRCGKRRKFEAGMTGPDSNNLYRVDLMADSAANRGSGALTYCATGEDFSLFFFTGCPVWWVQTNIP
jgi:hypothetical protein